MPSNPFNPSVGESISIITEEPNESVFTDELEVSKKPPLEKTAEERLTREVEALTTDKKNLVSRMSMHNQRMIELLNVHT